MICMTIATVRRLASDIMNVGENKVKISPEGLKEAEGALTRVDVKGLIDKGIITKKKNQGRDSTPRRGRTGHGHRRGTPVDAKTVWMQKVRAQRKIYHALVEKGVLKQGDKRAIYGKIKSGMLRSKRALLIYLKEANLVPKDYELPVAEFKKPQPRIPAKKEKPAPKAEPKAAAHTAAHTPAAHSVAPEQRHAAAAAQKGDQAHKPAEKNKGERK